MELRNYEGLSHDGTCHGRIHVVSVTQLSFQAEEAREYVDEIIFYIRDQFVDGRTSTAKALVMDCVVVTQNRHCIAQLDKAVYGEMDTCTPHSVGLIYRKYC